MKIKIQYQLTILFAVLISLSGCKVSGCLDVSALNYEKTADHDCSGVKGGSDKKCCKYPLGLNGCTDYKAANYNANATKDDGSCEYAEKIIKPFTTVSSVASLTKFMSKNDVRNKLGIYPFEIFHNKDNCEIHVYHYRRMQRTINVKNQFSKSALKNGEQVYEDEEFELTVFFKNGLLDNIINENSKNTANDLLCFNDNLKCSTVEDYLLCYGCMDDGTNDDYLGRPDYAKGTALNYNVDATKDDGSCTYADKPVIKGCMDKEAKNYTEDADINDPTLCDYCPCLFVLNPDYDALTQCNEQCIPDPNIKPEPKSGCTDIAATNYDSKAIKDNGSCLYCPCDSEDYYYVLNKSKNCVGNPCIKVKREKEKEIIKDDDCSLCDLVDIDNINFEIKAKAGANIKTKK